MWREVTSRVTRVLIEVVLVVMICVAPWAFGAMYSGVEFLLDAGVALLALLWGLRMLVDGKVAWTKCPVILCLAMLFVIGIWQITPLPQGALRFLSPASVRWYEQLLPSQPEELPQAENPGPAPLRPGSTISLDVHATRTVLQRLLAVLLVFAVARNNLSSSAAFRRLALIVVCNGAAISLFALAQFLSSPRDTLFWTYPSIGQHVFGPFIYRNHYACYVNLCIGMALGMLWSRQSARPDTAGDEGIVPVLSWRERLTTPLRLLHDPATLFLCVALALMVSSVLFTLSRGGFLALVGAFAICFLLRVASFTNYLRPGAIGISLALVCGLVGWFGLKNIESRYATLWGAAAFQESRLSLWRSAFGIVQDFPVWGTGYGTTRTVDPLYRTDAQWADVAVDHFHNDHLELLAESGIIGSLVCVLTLGLIFALAYRAIRARDATGGLALGGVFALLTLVLHSFGDFCTSVPSITLLATVLGAYLCAAGAHARTGKGQQSQDHSGPSRYVLSWHGFAPALAAMAALALGWIVISGGWTTFKTDRLRREAARMDEKRDDGREKTTLLEAAVRMSPFDAELRIELADAFVEVYRRRIEEGTRRDRTFAAASGVALLASGVAGGMPAICLPTCVTGTQAAWDAHGAAESARWKRTHLHPALSHYIQARNLGPLLPGSHLGLALHADELTRGNNASAYRDRTKLLAPSDPTFWYYCGNQELRNGQSKDAWKSWKRSLDLSDRYLTPILARATRFLDPEELARELLPDRPALLLAAATKLYPPDALMDRKPLLEKALRQLGEPDALSAKDLHLKAHIHRSLGQTAEAENAYRALLRQSTAQADWRYELAEVLYEDGRLEAARSELVTVLAYQPKHAAAATLLKKVTDDLLKN